tara:strand:+ start:781 stop:948 length:168 start_codon:yes stop_codon:yes gene_type:complete
MHTILTHPDTWPFMLIAGIGIVSSFIGVIILAAKHAKLKNQLITFLIHNHEKNRK